jgi:Protein ENHANCED DISEASE RESISTANCE 2, C-terminal
MTISSTPAVDVEEKPSSSDQQQSEQHKSDQERSITSPLVSSQLPTVSIYNPIRHSGRALVRGKFRRVWRPRHLEVLSNGLVRYYEVPIPSTPGGGSTLDVFVDSTGMTNHHTTPDFHAHSKIPKSTLSIHHARIIDVTTLRDMHVGLPRGSFGFLFHGQQIDDDEITGAAEDLFRDGMQLLSMGNCQGSPSLATPRDFLCAVNSLEEAQSWVFALQWAATKRRDAAIMHSGGADSFPYTLPGVGSSSDEAWEHHEDGLSVTSSLISPHHQRSQSGILSSSPLSTDTTTASSPPKPKPSTPRKQSAGKMIVTKAVGYTLIRLDLCKWEIAYQIHVLLVMPSQQQQQVQEWSILRTGQDMQGIIDNLRHTLSSVNSSQKVQEQTERIAMLPNLLQKPSSQQKPIGELGNSIDVVDSILRSFCMEAAVVNSIPMKRFLGLHQHRSSPPPVQQGSGFGGLHNPTAVLSRPKLTMLKQNTGIDQFVKEWLQRPQQKRAAPGRLFQFVCWCLRRPQPATTYAGALLSFWPTGCFLYFLYRFAQRFQFLPSISIRLDTLILSWCVAAGIGNVLGGIRRDDHSASAAHAKSTTRVSQLDTAKHAVVPIRSPRTSPNKHGPNCLSDTQGPLRPKAIPNKSLMDEADSQDLVVEVGDGEGMEENARGPEEDGNEAVERTTSFLQHKQDSRLSSPLPEHSTEKNITESCWSRPKDRIFNVRGPSYLTDRVKIPSSNASFTCRGVDMWMTDNPERHIARHPSVLGGRLANTNEDMFLVNFLLPFGNFVSYFSIPPLVDFASPQLADVWTRFVEGDQEYRDARLKLLPVVVDGPWIVRAAVPGTSPALLGKVIPLQYFFTQKPNGRSVYEVDVIITASTIAKGILSVVKGHAKSVSIAFAFIIEASGEHELPETVLASFQVNALHLEHCPLLPCM